MNGHQRACLVFPRGIAHPRSSHVREMEDSGTYVSCSARQVTQSNDYLSFGGWPCGPGGPRKTRVSPEMAAVRDASVVRAGGGVDDTHT